MKLQMEESSANAAADTRPDGEAPIEIEADPGASQTDWSMIGRAVHGEDEPSREAWEQLARRYWPAIYAYVRSTGRDVTQASDLTQGFVCDVMLGRRLLEAADPNRGRFRTLLLTALKHYLIEQHRYQSRRKRAPGGDGDGPRIVDLETEDPRVLALSDVPPEDAFAAQWSASLVHRVLELVREECAAEELTPHWTVFEMRVVRPMLQGDRPLPYGVLVDRFGLRDAAQAANMMITVKRRFARRLYQEVRRTVSEEAEVENELRSLLQALERPA
ncbi:MAG: RNA polymerase sigma factor [Planctomycetota bacterium]|jgi:RNA polymerase sigma-70 factor (ECF subfamily)